MVTKTILFHVPAKLGSDLKIKLAQDRISLREWGNRVVADYLSKTPKQTKPKK